MAKYYTLLCFLITISLTTSLYSQTSQKESEKMAIFCKVWGFLKYYHPTVAKGKLDWDKEFTTRVNIITKLNSKHELSKYYSEWISSIGKIKKYKKQKVETLQSLKFNLELKWLSDTLVFTDSLISKFQYLHQSRNQTSNYYVQQNPIGNTVYNNEKNYKDSIFPSVEIRLLGLSRYWNIINYFFPYKYKIGTNWDSVLVEMIPKFKDSKDTITYHLAMMELTAKINDSHAKFQTKYTNRFFGLKFLPFKFKLIDNKAIVTGFYNDSLSIKNDIQYGDVFYKINNKTISDLINENYKYVGASNHAVKLRDLVYVIFNGNTDSVKATYERNGIVSEKYLRRYYFKDFNYNWKGQNKNDTSKILANNIGYINMGLLLLKQVDSVMNKLKNTKALIFDCRNYPNTTRTIILKHLNKETKVFAKITYPDLNYPGIYTYATDAYCGTKNENYYKGKVVLIFNEETQSQAEFTIMALQTASNVISIGSHTSGADGDVSLITFPGGYKTYFSAIGIYYPNGKETQRIGIVPDIEVIPTIEGIKAKKDELILKALEVINSK